MSSIIKIRYVFLLLSLILLTLAINGLWVQKKISTVGLEVTTLGHDILHLRDEAMAFNSGHLVTPHLIAQDVVNSEKAVEHFVNETRTTRFNILKRNQKQFDDLIQQYARQHLNLAHSIDNLIALIIAKNAVKNELNGFHPDLLVPGQITTTHQAKYQELEFEISSLLNTMLLGDQANFVEETETQFKTIGLSYLRHSFILFSLALCSLTIFIILSSNRRVRHLKHLNEKLVQMTKKAERANEAKSTFLATMSHELRTPMNGVLGMAQLIADETQEESTKKNIQIINDSSEHLMIILNDILDFSKVEQGEMEFENVPFKLEQLIDPVTNALMPVAKEKNIYLQVERDNIPSKLIFSGDTSRLRQILFNIVGNAIKFTEIGGVKLICDFVPNEKKLTFWIKDTGVGIPKEKLTYIFDPFRQAETSTTRRFGGTGLGLSIVKRIVEQMGGDINVVSDEGKGSTFTIFLPVGTPEGQIEDDETEQSKVAKVASERLTLEILIADDNAVNATVGKRLCEKLGHRVTVVENGKKAVEAAQQQPYDLILMDKHMPEMDGIEAIKNIREILKLPTIIFACTADVFREAHDEFLEHGANHILTKPLQKSSIETAIQRFNKDFIQLKQQRKLDATVSSRPSNVTVLTRMPKQELPMTEEELSSSATFNAFEDKEERDHLLKLMITEFEKASDNLIQGFAESDITKIFQTLHTVKGTAQQLDLSNLAVIVKENEEKAKNGEAPEPTTLQKILNLMSVNIHQANRVLESDQKQTEAASQE